MPSERPTRNGIVFVHAQLSVMTICWFAVAFANALLTVVVPWTTTVVAILAFGAGVCTATLVVAPSAVTAYRVGGTLGVGAIGFRILSLLLMAGETVPIDDVVISVAITIMFNLLYWQWWLNVVGRWRKIIGWRPPPG